MNCDLQDFRSPLPPSDPRPPPACMSKLYWGCLLRSLATLPSVSSSSMSNRLTGGLPCLPGPVDDGCAHADLFPTCRGFIFWYTSRTRKNMRMGRKGCQEARFREGRPLLSTYVTLHARYEQMTRYVTNQPPVRHAVLPTRFPVNTLCRSPPASTLDH